jgi:hypothetical protein
MQQGREYIQLKAKSESESESVYYSHKPWKKDHRLVGFLKLRQQDELEIGISGASFSKHEPFGLESFQDSVKHSEDGRLRQYCFASSRGLVILTYYRQSPVSAHQSDIISKIQAISIMVSMRNGGVAAVATKQIGAASNHIRFQAYLCLTRLV